MFKKILSFVVAFLFAAICSATEPSVAPGEWRANLVTSLGSTKLGDIQNISDNFTFSQKIHAHVTLVAKVPTGVKPAKHRFTFKWFNADTLVHERSAVYLVSKSPYLLLHAVSAPVLGMGNCRVEIYLEKELLASRTFVVTEK